MSFDIETWSGTLVVYLPSDLFLIGSEARPMATKSLFFAEHPEHIGKPVMFTLLSPKTI